MTPLNAWALGGAALGLALPIVIHYMTRPRGMRRALPTFSFLLAAATFSTRHNKLRSILILTARALALLLLALGFARFTERSQATALNGAATRRIIVLDCSQSMAASTDGVTDVFYRARGIAQRLLQDGTAQEADLILAAQTSRPVFGQTSTNLGALQEEIARADVQPQALDAAEALARAAQSLSRVAAADLAQCEIAIISDFQRSNWAQASLGSLPKDVQVRLIAARDGAELPNAALMSARIDGVAEAGSSCVAIAEIANFGAIQADADVELEFEQRTWKRRIKLAPNARATAAFELAGLTPGWNKGWVRILSVEGFRDALPDDNQFPISLYVRPARRIVLLSVERPTDTGGPAYFMSKALAASPDATIDVTRYQPAQLDGEVDERIANADLLVLANVRTLSDSQAAAVTRLLARGASVLFVASSALDADNIKAIEASAGALLRLPVEFQPLGKSTGGGTLKALYGRGGEEGGGERFLVSAETRRRPFKIFGEALPQITRSLRLSGGLSSAAREQTGGGDDTILAKYSDGAAALVVARAGAGHFAVLNANVGGESGTLAAHPIFVPLIQELSLELIEGVGAVKSVYRPGKPLSFILSQPAKESDGLVNDTWRLKRSDGSVVGAGPGTASVPVFKADAANVTLLWSECGAPDAYRIEHDGKIAAAFVVSPPHAEESDLAVLDPEFLKKRVAENQRVTSESAGADGGDDPEKEHPELFFLGALFFLFCEIVLLKAFKT